jgi:hypothetical protein
MSQSEEPASAFRESFFNRWQGENETNNEFTTIDNATTLKKSPFPFVEFSTFSPESRNLSKNGTETVDNATSDTNNKTEEQQFLETESSTPSVTTSSTSNEKNKTVDAADGKKFEKVGKIDTRKQLQGSLS